MTFGHYLHEDAPPAADPTDRACRAGPHTPGDLATWKATDDGLRISRSYTWLRRCGGRRRKCWSAGIIGVSRALTT